VRTKAEMIGELLRKERETRGLSVDRAAEAAEIAPNHLAEIEVGFRDGRGLGPSVEVLERVARTYGLQVWLVPVDD
jgi:transcriptional regulator with XRE-family HTH domain